MVKSIFQPHLSALFAMCCASFSLRNKSWLFCLKDTIKGQYLSTFIIFVIFGHFDHFSAIFCHWAEANTGRCVHADLFSNSWKCPKYRNRFFGIFFGIFGKIRNIVSGPVWAPLSSLSVGLSDQGWSSNCAAYNRHFTKPNAFRRMFTQQLQWALPEMGRQHGIGVNNKVCHGQEGRELRQ